MWQLSFICDVFLEFEIFLKASVTLWYINMLTMNLHQFSIINRKKVRPVSKIIKMWEDKKARRGQKSTPRTAFCIKLFTFEKWKPMN